MGLWDPVFEPNLSFARYILWSSVAKKLTRLAKIAKWPQFLSSESWMLLISSTNACEYWWPSDEPFDNFGPLLGKLREKLSTSVFGEKTEGLFSIGGAWVNCFGGSGFRNSGGGGKDEACGGGGGGAGKLSSTGRDEFTISFGSYFVWT